MSTAIATMVKMLEMLPEITQAQIVEHLREYIAEMHDNIGWDTRFQRTQEQLVAAARQAKQGIAASLAEPIDHTQP
jgi:hypothetical protein